MNWAQIVRMRATWQRWRDAHEGREEEIFLNGYLEKEVTGESLPSRCREKTDGTGSLEQSQETTSRSHAKGIPRLTSR